MRETVGYYNRNTVTIIRFLFAIYLSLQLPAANAQCDAVIGSNLLELSGCEVFTVQFYDQSAGVLSRSWDFGDGTATSNAQNPVHSFNAGAGDTTYTVTLEITCASGTSTVEEIVNVYAKPEVNFTTNKSTVCAITDSVCFDNLSDYHVLNTYSWNFGDGTVSEKLEPCKIYSTPGNYSTSLTVTNEHGCLSSYSMTDSIRVEPVPSTAFSVSSYEGCVPFTVAFDNNTDTVGNAYSEWTWEFGDGSENVYAYEAEPHTFTSPGEYTIRLAATNTLGCSNYSTQIITVNPSPVASFMTSAPECQNDFTTIEFTGSYLSSPAFSWDFDEAAIVIGSGEGPYNIKWSEAGNKQINLTIDDNGCSSLYSEKIEVTPIAMVYLHLSASHDTICSGESVTFTASPLNFPNYSFYVNNSLVQSSVNNEYEGYGFNDGDIIYVKITDANGCSEIISDTVTISVRQTPVVSLSSSVTNDTSCIAEPVMFTASPAGYDDYQFLVNNTEIQAGAGNLYITSDLADQDRVNVVATHNGCSSTPSNTRKTTILDALPPPDVYCGTSTPNSLRFAWDSIPGAVAYEISIDNGTFQTASSGTLGLYHDMGGLAENEEHTIQIKAVDSYLCGTEIVSEEVTCAAENCTAIAFEPAGKQREVCQNETVTLSIENISIPDYSISWDGSPSAEYTDYSFIAGEDVEIPVTVINNEEPQCPTVTKTFIIDVTPRVEVNLLSAAPDNTVCGSDSVTFSILPGTLDQYRLYDNGEMIGSGIANSYTVSNVSNGHFYYASATDNACLLFSDTLQMSVYETVNTPAVVFESATENSVTFGWEPVPGATGYLVSENENDFAFPSSGSTGLTHTVIPMDPGNAVSLTAIAISDGLCGNSEISLPAFGYAELCDTIRFNISGKHNICLGDSVNMKITDLTIDHFDIFWGPHPPNRQKSRWIKPDADTIVRVTVKNRYQPFCAGATKYVSITVSERPAPLTLSSSDSDNEVCLGDQLIFKGTPGGYDDFEFYDYSNLLQQGPFNTMTINAEKELYNIRIRAINRGCPGEFSNSIETRVLQKLNQPQVNCGNSSGTSLSFVWDAVPEALSYEVSIDGQSYMPASSGPGGLMHEITGLNAGDSSTISIIAAGTSDCMTSVPSQQITCYAIDCDIITFDIDPYLNVCENETVNLDLTNINVPDYSVSWNNGDYGTTTSTELTAENDTSVSVSLLDNNQASCPPVSKSFVIDVINIVPVTLTSSAENNMICEGGELNLSISPETFERYIFLNGTDTLQDGIDNTLKQSGIPENFTVRAEVYQGSCLTNTNTITTETVIPAALNLTASVSGTVCREEPVVFTATPGFELYYFDNSSYIVEETDQNSATIPVSDSRITVTAIDEHSCISVSTDTIEFNLLEPPNVMITCSTDTICYGEFAAYYAFPEGLDNFTFYRNDTPFQSSSSNYYSTDSLRTGDIVSVTGKGANGCVSDTVLSSYPYIIPYPDYSINASDEGVCLNDSLELYLETSENDPQYIFYWSTGETTDTITVQPLHTTNYNLFYSDGRCNNIRIDSKTIAVDTETPPEAYAGEDITICINDSIQLEANGGISALWSPSDELTEPDSYTPFVSPIETTVYSVTVKNTYCENRDSVTVFVDLCLEGLTSPVPQIITPNGDGINDYWEIEHIDYFELNSLKIFNRWGAEVFSASPYLNEWHGQSNNGVDLPDGTYYYMINLGNGNKDQTGYLIIHR